MSFFRRKEKILVPPVEHEQERPPPSRSPAPSSATYVASQGGDSYGNNSYGQQTSYGGYGGSYGGGSYGSRGGAPDPNASELFSGRSTEDAGRNRFLASERGPELHEPIAGQETEEDVEGIKQQIRATKQESVNSTRNALRLAREAEETAQGTLQRLGDQSGKLADTERHLDLSKNASAMASDHADEIRKLNRSIFIPAISFDKKAKRDAKAQKIQDRYEEDRIERERGLMDVRESRNNLENASAYGRGGYGNDGGGGRGPPTEAQRAARKKQRGRFQFDATASDDEKEDELDDNLDEIADVTKRLHNLGKAMGQELDNQNKRIQRIDDKASALDTNLFVSTQKLKRI